MKIFKNKFMKRNIPLTLILAVVIAFTACSTFIKDGEVEMLKVYERGEENFIDYTLLVDASRDDYEIRKGARVRIVITTGSDWIKVYVYRAEEDLLLSRRVLVLYLFEEDFPDKKYDPDFFRDRLYEVVKPLS